MEVNILSCPRRKPWRWATLEHIAWFHLAWKLKSYEPSDTKGIMSPEKILREWTTNKHDLKYLLKCNV